MRCYGIYIIGGGQSLVAPSAAGAHFDVNRLRDEFEDFLQVEDRNAAEKMLQAIAFLHDGLSKLTDETVLILTIG